MTIETQASSIEKSTLGQNYQYAQFIKTPNQLGMKGTGAALGDNIKGITNYIDLLIYGNGGASTSPQRPLGNRYFMNTGGKCTNTDGAQVARSIYINNVPSSKGLTFLQDLGLKTSSLRGLIPGMMEDITKLNPASIAAAFTESPSPGCTSIYMNTVDENNKSGTSSGFVVNGEINDIDPCAFVSRKNPITNEPCAIPPTNEHNITESFISAIMNTNRKRTTFKNKPIANIYTALVSGLLLYITYKLIYKNA